jgi:adenosine deaminase
MIQKNITPSTILPPFLLANSNLLKRLELLPFDVEMNETDFEEAVYLAYQPWRARYPDHVFRSHWSLVKQEKKSSGKGWVYSSLKLLSDEYLYFRGEKLHVHLSIFGDWQNLLSRISALPIHVAAYSIPSVKNRMGKLIIPNNNGIFTLVYPYEPVVDAYITEEGLHETHLHLNGTTSAEWCWLRALYNPKQELNDFCDQYRKNNLIRELCHSINPDLNPNSLNGWLKKARLLRCWLMAIADGRAESYSKKSKQDLDSIKKKISPLPDNISSLLLSLRDFPFLDNTPTLFGDVNSLIEQEVQWLCEIIKQLSDKPSKLTDRLLHLYLLIQNQYLQLVVQREDMYGFDQFQKYTFTDLREASEKKYLYRFLQLSGGNPQRSNINWLEGRFAPKNELKKNEKILSSILKGYLFYLSSNIESDYQHWELSQILEKLNDQVALACSVGSRKYFKLALVVHFIKEECKYEIGKQDYRHKKLRLKLKNQCDILQKTLERWPRLSQWIRGIDAASNELHAPPEIFAPFYRAAKQYGILHRSYHVGEDFPHLISGIRQIIDVMDLLDFQVGDRIGHGTAVGIDPEIWINSMPSQIVIQRGEWLLDLLIIWDVLKSKPECYEATQKITKDINIIISDIFQHDMEIKLETLLVQMRYRGLLPEYVFNAIDDKDEWCWQTSTFNDVWRQEAYLVAKVLKKNKLDILAKWWRDPNVIMKSKEHINIDSNYLDIETLILLQQSTLRRLAEARIVIETLPTSNVRISQYQHYREHHALRWMRVEGFQKPNDPTIAVSLGSDDPGIFANDIVSDFYHLYAVLVEKGLSDSEAIQKLRDVNERGKLYRFHDPELFG